MKIDILFKKKFHRHPQLTTDIAFTSGKKISFHPHPSDTIRLPDNQGICTLFVRYLYVICTMIYRTNNVQVSYK